MATLGFVTEFNIEGIDKLANQPKARPTVPGCAATVPLLAAAGQGVN